MFVAEGLAKLTRRPGVAALTAGPGVTNGVSGITSVLFNGSPLVVLGGRSSDAGWGRGALQEFDHVPMLAPVTKHAATVHDTAAIAPRPTPPSWPLLPNRGPVFVDYPLDRLFAPGAVTWTPGPVPRRDPRPRRRGRPRPPACRRRAARDHRRHRPVLGRGVDAAGARRPSTSARRCSRTAWAAAAFRPTTSSPTAARSCCCAARPISSW